MLVDLEQIPPSSTGFGHEIHRTMVEISSDPPSSGGNQATSTGCCWIDVVNSTGKRNLNYV
jgi:hypothetical protein